MLLATLIASHYLIISKKRELFFFRLFSGAKWKYGETDKTGMMSFKLTTSLNNNSETDLKIVMILEILYFPLLSPNN